MESSLLSRQSRIGMQPCLTIRPHVAFVCSMDGWTKARLATLVVLGAWMASAQTTFAHGGRIPFDTWGGFTGDVLRCQRVIAQAAAQCATGAWAARRACREITVAGG